MSDHADGSVSDEDYEVEGIVGHKDSSRNGRQYEVKWKGYKETTFEPRENLVPNSEELIVEYDKKHPFKKLKVSTRSRSGSKHKKEVKSRKNEVDKILDSQNEDDSTDSNIENKKPNVEAQRKRKLSKRMKTKLKSHKKNRKKESARAKKVVKASRLRSRKKKGRKKRSVRMVLLKSSTEEEYEVDLLLKHRDLEDGRMYLVKWKGYRKSEATWEPSANLSCRTLVRQYEHIRGKWKLSRKRASGSSDKQPTKRMRTKNASDSSNHETKEEVKKQVRKRLIKRKDGTWSNLREYDNAEKEEATAHADGDEKETSAGDMNEKKEDMSKGGKRKKLSEVDAKAGEEKSEDKGETRDEVEQTKPGGEEGSQDDKDKTKNNSPQGKKDKSPEGKKGEEEKQVEDKNKE